MILIFGCISLLSQYFNACGPDKILMCSIEFYPSAALPAPLSPHSLRKEYEDIEKQVENIKLELARLQTLRIKVRCLWVDYKTQQTLFKEVEKSIILYLFIFSKLLST